MKIQIGDTTHELEFSVNSVCDLEETTRLNIRNVFAMGEFSSFRALLWCGLLKHNPKLTMRQAGDLLEQYLTEFSQDELGEKISGAIDQAGFLRAQGTSQPK